MLLKHANLRLHVPLQIKESNSKHVCDNSTLNHPIKKIFCNLIPEIVSENKLPFAIDVARGLKRQLDSPREDQGYNLCIANEYSESMPPFFYNKEMNILYSYVAPGLSHPSKRKNQNNNEGLFQYCCFCPSATST